MHPLPALVTPLPLAPFTSEETTVCTNEAVNKGAKKIHLPVFLFHVLLFQYCHQLMHLNLLMIL